MKLVILTLWRIIVALWWSVTTTDYDLAEFVHAPRCTWARWTASIEHIAAQALTQRFGAGAHSPTRYGLHLCTTYREYYPGYWLPYVLASLLTDGCPVHHRWIPVGECCLDCGQMLHDSIGQDDGDGSYLQASTTLF